MRKVGAAVRQDVAAMRKVEAADVKDDAAGMKGELAGMKDDAAMRKIVSEIWRVRGAVTLSHRFRT